MIFSVLNHIFSGLNKGVKMGNSAKIATKSMIKCINQSNATFYINC